MKETWPLGAFKLGHKIKKGRKNVIVMITNVSPLQRAKKSRMWIKKESLCGNDISFADRSLDETFSSSNLNTLDVKFISLPNFRRKKSSGEERKCL